MRIPIQNIYGLAKSTSFEEFQQKIKSVVADKPIGIIINGELIINVELIADKPTLSPNNFRRFNEIVVLFNKKFYNETAWLDCYDKLIRLDKYSEDEILAIAINFRKEGNWWRDSGNFETLLKLRKPNREKIKYIDVFSMRMKESIKPIRKGFPIGSIIQKEDGKQRTY